METTADPRFHQYCRDKRDRQQISFHISIPVSVTLVVCNTHMTTFKYLCLTIQDKYVIWNVTLSFIHSRRLKKICIPAYATKIMSHTVQPCILSCSRVVTGCCSALSWAWIWQPVQIPCCPWHKQSRQVYVKLSNLTTASRGECRWRDWMICILSRDNVWLVIILTKLFLNSYALLTVSTKQWLYCPQGGRH